jgi:hypothetical protein
MKFYYKYLVSIFIVFILLFNTTLSVFAATIRSGESVYIPEDQQKLQDLYLFGNTITIDAPILNDLAAAGNSVTLNGDVTGSVFTAGSDVFIRSKIGNTLRAAGGTVAVSAPITHDVLIAGGNIRIAKSASISGDLLIAGGQVQIEAPVKGKIYVIGGDVTINNIVGGNVEGQMDSLTLGNAAFINGNLSYKSENKAVIKKGAVIRGKNEFKQLDVSKNQPQGLAAIFTVGSLYKLAIDIIISLLLIILIPVLLRNILDKIIHTPLGMTGYGFLFLVFWPLFSLILLIMLMLGLASFLFYGLILISTIFLSKILTGWCLMQWWEKRNKKEYSLNWKAGIIGPVAFFIIGMIPVAGWLIAFIIYLMSLGGTTKYLFEFIKTQKH